MNKEPIISIKNLWKSFGKNDVLKGINLTVNKGEDLVILGRSGSGKSVAIKCLVGLVEVDKGEIKVFGTDVTNLKNDELNKIRVRIGFMFQNGALYDSMSVRQNLAFTLKHHTKDLSNEEIENKINEALENVGLKEAIDKMPSELSGGMRKRIGLARTLIINPEIILYDEPTSGLDTITSREISELILSIQKKYKTTSIIITHDMACAKRTGNRIMILKDGVINAEGSYEELEKSKDEWVKSFFI
ncbi:ATP-binding cassette domain-containing protein [Flavobacterium psychrophilum]|uniref:ABC transporter ATP-binding protein n=1 Tax=Flavobacterium psychrophilum TaxID=96345 RepID=UPI00090C5A3B|nr:ATP-binding cassette domain-containing protein [Flavobacterium psychrophilum]EKT2070502.1 ATP-binding cassette domain-containing protein [Flavobacterium psychrophilum]EKT2072879.1 ATP-binding cassette domain-containing protein [Flavobacterium psychrophilum]EKT4492294.1 ATP-binding cassette domain-containing protein [Flavobacterium psychrophilum]SHH93623.1 Probable ABC-type transport system, ATPase component [Flavobacterium psychrophilum]